MQLLSARPWALTIVLEIPSFQYIMQVAFSHIKGLIVPLRMTSVKSCAILHFKQKKDDPSQIVYSRFLTD